jgi:AsmA protein
MPATLALSPEAVSALTLGRVKVTEPVPIGFRLGGPAWRPRVEGLVLDGAVKALVTAAATGALGKAGIDAGAVQEKAKDVKAGAEAGARKAADDAKQKLEEAAKEKLKGLFGR